MTATALIIDDSPILGLQLGQWLEGFGFTVRSISAVDCESACRGAGHERAWPQELALIFVELAQAQGNGFQLLRQLQPLTRCPLVLVSGSGRSSDVEWGLQAGAAAVLSRPLASAALAACLRQLQLLPESKQVTSEASASESSASEDSASKSSATGEATR